MTTNGAGPAAGSSGRATGDLPRRAATPPAARPGRDRAPGPSVHQPLPRSGGPMNTPGDSRPTTAVFPPPAGTPPYAGPVAGGTRIRVPREGPGRRALHAGALADRVPKRRQMIAGDLACATALACVPAAAATGTLTLPLLMTVAAVQGAGAGGPRRGGHQLPAGAGRPVAPATGTTSAPHSPP